MRTEIEETLYLRVAFGAAIGGNRLRKEEANESLVAWEAATRPRSTRNRKSVELSG